MNQQVKLSDAMRSVIEIITQTTRDGLDPPEVESIARLLNGDESDLIVEMVPNRVFVYRYTFCDQSSFEY